MKNRVNVLFLAISLVILIIISVPLTSFLGSASIGITDVLKVYLGQITNKAYDTGTFKNIIWDLRLPRAILAVCVGGGLSLCGSVMQSLTKNIMAEPYTLGVASGASFMASLCIGFLSENMLIVASFAFCGALISMLIVYRLSQEKNGATSTRLILSGIGISMIFSALVQLIMSVVGSEKKIKGIVFWSMGSVGLARWDNILFPVLVLIISFIIVYSNANRLNALSLGKEAAVILGVDVKFTQKILIFTISILTGVMVALSGTIGFVGLIVPHIVRKIVGADNKRALPVVMLGGALFLVWIDAIARSMLAPKELPIGVLTALIGGPLFISFMRNKEV